MLGINGEGYQIVPLLPPSSDMFNTGPASICFNHTLYRESKVVVSTKSGGTDTGVGKIQVEACSAEDGSDATAIDFSYMRASGGASPTGDLTDTVAATGVSTEAGEDEMIVIELRSRQLPDGKPWVRVNTSETVNDPVLGEVFAILSRPHVTENSMPSALE